MQCPECGDPDTLAYARVNWNGEEYTDVGVNCSACGYGDY